LNFSLGDSSAIATQKKNETTESPPVKLEKEIVKVGKQTTFSSQKLKTFSKTDTGSKRQKLSQEPNLISRKISLKKELKRGVQTKCQDVLGVRESVVEEGILLHSGGGVQLKEGPVVPYKIEKLS